MVELLPLTIVPLPVKLRAADFLMLDEAGALEPYGKTELLDGEIVYMNAQHRPHALLKMALYEAIQRSLRNVGSPLTTLVEASIALSEHDTPEPDLTLTDDPRGEGLVPLASVFLLIEVADATLQSDLTRKALIYARAGIAEYWVADVNGRVVHQLWKPGSEGYDEHREIAFGEELKAVTLRDLVVETGGF